MNQVEAIVLNTIKTHRLLSEGDAVLVAVSGGADSVALLKVLATLSGPLGVDLSVGHVNHQLRGKEADADEAFVKSLCEALDVPMEARRSRPLVNEASGNLENDARKARYDLLAEMAQSRGAVIATAHTLNDQAETFLMKLLRGAGPAGLSGILVRRNHLLRGSKGPTEVGVVRPLLEVSRDQIIEYLEHVGLQFREDATNAETTYDRNWVRHNLIPMLKERLNPQLVAVLARSASLFSEVDAYLQQEAQNVLNEVSSLEDEDLLIPAESLVRLAPILGKQVVRSSIRYIKGDLEGISQRHVEDVLSLTTKPSGRRLDLPGGLSVAREFDWIRFHKREREPQVFRYEIEVPGEARLKEVGKTVRVREWSAGAGIGVPVLLVPGRILVLRSRQPGDRFRISDRSPRKSLKKLFIERKIPLRKRDRLVVCESGGEIVWVEELAPEANLDARERERVLFTIEVQNETF